MKAGSGNAEQFWGVTVPPADDPLWSDLRTLARRAVTDGPAAGVARLGRAGLLAVDPASGEGLPPAQARAMATMLRRLGRADQVMGRLYEGHLNALKLVALHASDEVRRAALTRAGEGAFFGVWGADDTSPARLEHSGDTLTLRGAKRFCSGLGVVCEAVVVVQTEAGSQLILVPVGDPARSDPSAWTASAMRASVSGRYDLDGLSLPASRLLGPPGIYANEPYFEGGIWRYCAVHTGGAEALLAMMQDQLTARKRACDPMQSARFAEGLIAAHTARLMVEAAAVAVGAAEGASPDTVNRAVTLSLLTREAVEQRCLQVIALVERALGMGAFDGDSDIDRMRRDLSLFLRQANTDGKLALAAKLMRDGGWDVGETW